MRKLMLALAAATMAVGVAHAGDKPLVGPAPAWARPATPAPEPAKPDEAPVRLLLSDTQIAVEGGRDTVYMEMALKIQTPQGLAAGNLSFPWRPDTDELTVHKIRIRRGKEMIDVLASGQTFTVVRREQNLENAVLDGMLTANIQPEGLQVGDILEFSASISSHDPVMRNHVELLGAAWNGIPIGRARLRVQWPNSVPMRIRQAGGLPPIRTAKAGGQTSFELALDNVEPLQPPKGAPARYQLGRLVELTDFASWADLAALMAPLYDKAAVLPEQGPLRAEFERIRNLSADPRLRAEAALALVQDRVRYVALAMGSGGLVPADAETSWARRYGDCKGKTALLLALLHALDVEAVPVIVSAGGGGDGLDARLPMVGLFNHVLVRARIGGRDYWLDGTRTGDTGLDRLATPDFGWGLPLLPSGAALVRVAPAPLETPDFETTIRIDATGGILTPAPTRIEVLLRGDAAISVNAGLASLTGALRDSALRNYWKEQYDFVEVKAAKAVFDAKAGELHLSMDGMATMDWSSGWYETDGTGVGHKADFSRDPGQDQAAPFAVGHPYFHRVTETILLPRGFPIEAPGASAEVNQKVAGIEYRRHATVEGQVFRIERNERSLTSEFPASEAAAAQATLRGLAEKRVYLRLPDRYRPTEKDLAAVLAKPADTPEARARRGTALLDAARFDEALAEFEQVVTLKPSSAEALANRGIARVWKRDFDGAARDLDAAHAIDPRNTVVFRARGLMAQLRNAPADALKAYTAALDIEPDSSFALGHRAEVQRELGNDDAALADSAAALKLQPVWAPLYLLRANIFRGRGKTEEALGEAAAVQAADPDNAYAHVLAARIYGSYGRSEEATRAFDRALAIKPEAYIYLNRSQIRRRSDIAGRRADLDAALKLEPGSIDVLGAQADLQAESGDLTGAIAAYSKLLRQTPGQSHLLGQRGIVYARAGNALRANADFEAARNAVGNATGLNNLCWSKATAGVALEAALADCNAALAQSPDIAGFLDSRGLVYLRLGRLDEAMVDYDRALAKNPRLASSLYGRAIVWARKGDKVRSDADAAAAIRANPDVRENYVRYGITP